MFCHLSAAIQIIVGVVLAIVAVAPSQTDMINDHGHTCAECLKRNSAKGLGESGRRSSTAPTPASPRSSTSPRWKSKKKNKNKTMRVRVRVRGAGHTSSDP